MLRKASLWRGLSRSSPPCKWRGWPASGNAAKLGLFAVIKKAESGRFYHSFYQYRVFAMDDQRIPQKGQAVLFGLANWAFLFAGLANLVVGTWAAVNSNAPIAGTTLVAGLVLLFAATIDRFESLKGLGVEAKTRQLDRKILQADEVLRRLRETAEMTFAALIELNNKAGRYGGAPTPREAIALANRTRKILEDLGSERTAVSAVLKPWARLLCFDLAKAELADLNQLIRAKRNELETERSRLPQVTLPTDPTCNQLTHQIEELSAFLEKSEKRLYQLELNDYPDRVMALFEDVPLIDQADVRRVKLQVSKFADDMRSLRDNQVLLHPEDWIREIDRDRGR